MEELLRSAIREGQKRERVMHDKLFKNILSEYLISTICIEGRREFKNKIEGLDSLSIPDDVYNSVVEKMVFSEVAFDLIIEINSRLIDLDRVQVEEELEKRVKERLKTY